MKSHAITSNMAINDKFIKQANMIIIEGMFSPTCKNIIGIKIKKIDNDDVNMI